MQFSQKHLSTIAIAALCLLAQAQTTFAAFTDVPTTTPQGQAIEELRLRKVINGFPDKTFKPNKLITRAEFLKMVFTDVGYQAPAQNSAAPEKSSFSDVAAKSWIAPYVKKAVELNALNGNGGKTAFNPEKALSRIEAMKIAFPIAGIATPYYTDINPEELFKDVPPTATYSYLARAAKRNNIASSKHPDLLWADQFLTRGDAAEFVYQLQRARENEGLTTTTTSTTGTQNNESDSDLLNNPKFGILLDVWEKANNQFYNNSQINKDQLVYGAIQGMLGKLGDQYTVFEEPGDAKDLRQFLQGEFEGIGTEMDIINSKIVIKKILPGSPAEKANLQTGDVIQKIDGQSAEKLTVNQTVNLIRGEAGTTVTLTIQRGTQSMEVKITRAKLTLSSINGKMMNGIAYIEITEFTKASANDFTTTLNELNKQSPKGYILDLRDNPGGYVDSTVLMLNHFIEKDKLSVSIKTATSNDQMHSDGPGELKGKPLVVLVNKASASAAEIMAGAIQDYKLGKLVGTTTHGKGSVQEITNYSDKSLLKLSIAHWLTPNGRDINGIGLTPDFALELDQNQLLKGTDNQLQKAVDLINAGTI